AVEPKYPKEKSKAVSSHRTPKKIQRKSPVRQKAVMDQQRLVRVSKYLSKHLRHQPQRLGLHLEPGGWVAIDDLLRACERNSFALSRSELDEVVRRNDKQRFTIDPTGTRIRANQGHSVSIDLQLEPVEPPALLYHGTGQASVHFIL